MQTIDYFLTKEFPQGLEKEVETTKSVLNYLNTSKNAIILPKEAKYVFVGSIDNGFLSFELLACVQTEKAKSVTNFLKNEIGETYSNIAFRLVLGRDTKNIKDKMQPYFEQDLQGVFTCFSCVCLPINDISPLRLGFIQDFVIEQIKEQVNMFFCQNDISYPIIKSLERFVALKDNDFLKVLEYVFDFPYDKQAVFL